MKKHQISCKPPDNLIEIKHIPPVHSRDCTAVSEDVLKYLNNSSSENTERARKADLLVFINWGGRLPSSPEEVANFFADQAKNKKISTLRRYASSINHWHGAKQLLSPCKSELVKAVLRGISRTHGNKPKQAKPLLIDDIKLLIDSIQGSRYVDYRNRALISLGFSGAFRRSELLSIQVKDIEFLDHGVRISLPKSKTNQEGKPEIKAIPYAKRQLKYCPVRLLKTWLVNSGIADGPVFRRIIGAESLSNTQLTTDAFYKSLKQLCINAEIAPDGISPHSLRAGLITTAYLEGKDRYKTKQVSGHKNDETFDKYIRDTDQYRDNAADLF